MLVPPDVQELHSAHLLLWRAWEKVGALEAHIARWVHSGGYRFEKSTDSDGVLHIVIRYNELPAEWSLLIGEAVHGLRASLDHLIFGLSTLAASRPLTPEEGSATEFPIFGRKAMTDDALERRAGLLGRELQEALRNMQPHLVEDYARHWLWVLHELDNRSKHRTIPTALVAYSAFRPLFPLRGDGTTSVVTPDSPLHDGLEVFSGIPADPAGRTDIAASMQVEFPHDSEFIGGVIAGAPVVDTLYKLCDRVLDTFNALVGLAGYLVALPDMSAPLKSE